MDLPAFKFVDGQLVELPKQTFHHTLREAVLQKLKPPTLANRKISPRDRQRLARKGRPRREAIRVDAQMSVWRFPEQVFDYVIWKRHTIVFDECVDEFAPGSEVITRPVCFVYMRSGAVPGDDVMRAVDRWYRQKRT